MGIEVSIVMNSYNKYPQCLYSLYALENQTFDLSKVEVIFVDDASTDETPSLMHYNPPYTFKYIRCETNQGRSKSKNIGIYAAQGNIIMMLDAEVIVEPHCVEQQYLYHQSESLLAVTTCLNHYSTYTVYDKKFTNSQKSHFYDIVRKMENKLPISSQSIVQKRKLKRVRKDKVQIFTKEDIQSQRYKDLSFPNPFFPELVEHFGKDFNHCFLPWIFVIPQKLSFKRSLIDAIGPFYEGFQGWGAEDWEFGYRLYKHGVKIIDEPNIRIYHQEHPRNMTDDKKEGDANYLTFFRRYYSFDVGCLYLWRLGKDLYYVNELIKEYEKLSESNPSEYSDLIGCFIRLFEVVLEQVVSGKEITYLRSLSGLDENKLQSALIQKEKVDSLGHYPHIVNAFDFLLSL